MKRHNALVVCAGVALLLAPSQQASAQEVSLSVSIDGTSCNGKPYKTTNGDRSLVIAFGYELARGLRLAAGFMDRQDGTSRNGVRVRVGGTFMLTWPLR